MPYFDDTSGLDFDAQEQAMLQQAARIKALRGMDLSTTIAQPQNFRSAVTGADIVAPTVKKPLLSSLTPLIQDTAAGAMENESIRSRSALSAAEQADAVSQLKNSPRTQEAYYSPNAGATGGTGGNLVEANYNPAKEPSQNDILEASAKLYRNPLTKALAGTNLEYQLTKAPGEALTRALAAEEKRRAQFNADRTYAETHNYHQAQLGKQGTSGFQDSGLSDDKGAKLYAHPDGRMYSANYPLQETGEATIPMKALPPVVRASVTESSTAHSPTPVPFETPRRGTQGADPKLVGGIQSPPAAIGEAAQKEIEGMGSTLSSLQDLRARQKTLPPSLAADVLPTNIGKSRLVESLDPDTAKRAGFHSDMQDFVNNKLYESSGKAINEQEMVRIKATMPGPFASNEEWERWGQRTEEAMKVAIVRRQELATHPKDYKLDPVANAVVNTRTGKVVPGTESPFTQDIVNERVKAEGEPKWTGGETDPLGFDIRNPVDKALAQRAYANRGKAAPAAPSSVDDLVKKYRKK